MRITDNDCISGLVQMKKEDSLSSGVGEGVMRDIRRHCSGKRKRKRKRKKLQLSYHSVLNKKMYDC